ncbi:hypothetical protein MUP95_09990, partial [bacterium]|nr:hypothetical protein [bacterium]
MKTESDKIVKNKRVYQVAKEFAISNEALTDFLREHNFKVRNHMAPLGDVMYEKVCQFFVKKEVEVEKEPDFRKRLQEKRYEEEARIEAVRHEIDEVLERSKGDVFERVEIIQKKQSQKPKVVRKKVKPEPK